MKTKHKSPVSTYRSRLKRQGIVRLEIHVKKDDAGLLRNVARALTDPAREQSARALIRREFAGPAKLNFKEFLASAPLEGIDLERSRDTGRPVDL